MTEGQAGSPPAGSAAGDAPEDPAASADAPSGPADDDTKLPRALKNIQVVCAGVFIAWAVGVLAINWIYGAAMRKPNLGASFTVGSAYAAAAFGGGMLAGLLFGIPRSRSSDNGDSANYTPNTALEQISDWLTKIIVGVGLTQFAGIAAFGGRLVDTMSRGLGSSPSDVGFAASLLIISVVVGFVVSYLLSRTILPYYFDLSDVKRRRATGRDSGAAPAQADTTPSQ